MVSWSLTAYELRLTRDKVAKLNDRARKRGWRGRLSVVADEREFVTEVAGVPVTEVRWETRITGEAPRYGDGRWVLLAALDWTETGVIVRTAPGVESVDREGLRQGRCDHCKTDRFRKAAYVVGDGDRQLQVGSTCLRDFLGHDVSPVFVSTGEIESEVERGCFGGGELTWSVLSVLALSWAVVQAHGFVPSQQPGSTRDKVATVLQPDRRVAAEVELADQVRAVADQAVARAAELRDWVLSNGFAGDSDYVRNLKVLCAERLVSGRHLGLLVSAVQAWAKAQASTFVRASERAEIVDEWVGAEKEKLTLRVRVQRVGWVDAWDPRDDRKPVYTLVSEGGHVFEWFASREVLGDAPTDAYVLIRGTVSKHTEYQGRKITRLTRCRLVTTGS